MANSSTTDTSLGDLAGMGAGAALGGPLGAILGGSAGGLLGSLFGGNPDQDAINQLTQALQQIQSIPVPTEQDLQLALQPLVQQGVITPQAYQTVTENPQQFISELQSMPSTGIQAQQSALSQLQDIYETGGNTPQMQEQLAQTEAQLGQNENAEQQAIMQNAAERGVANSGATTSAELSAAGRNAYNANQQGISALSAEYQAALQALASAGTLGGNIQNENLAQTEAEQNDLNSALNWNATNTQAQNNLNTSTTNQAQAANLQLAQDIAQYNNQITNQQAEYNAQLPQTIYQDQLSKGEAAAGEANNLAGAETTGTEMTAGEQAGLLGGLGTALSNYENTQTLSNALSGLNSSNSSPSATSGSVLSQVLPVGNSGQLSLAQPTTMAPVTTPQFADGGVMPDQDDTLANELYTLTGKPDPNESSELYLLTGKDPNLTNFACGGITDYSEGGPVKGRSPYPGDDQRNDKQLAALSGGEAVIPRTVVASHPLDISRLLSFKGETPNPAKINPDDIKSVLQALSLHRSEVAGGAI